MARDIARFHVPNVADYVARPGCNHDGPNGTALVRLANQQPCQQSTWQVGRQEFLGPAQRSQNAFGRQIAAAYRALHRGGPMRGGPIARQQESSEFCLLGRTQRFQTRTGRKHGPLLANHAAANSRAATTSGQIAASSSRTSAAIASRSRPARRVRGADDDLIVVSDLWVDRLCQPRSGRSTGRFALPAPRAAVP